MWSAKMILHETLREYLFEGYGNEILYDFGFSSISVASFPGSSAPERETEFIHAERAWYLFSREKRQR